LPQLDKIAERTRHRASSIEFLRRELADVPELRILAGPIPETTPAFYKVGMQLDAARVGLSRDRFAAALRAEGIAIDAGFAALHVGRSSGRYKKSGSLIEAERAHRECLILHHPVLLESESCLREIAVAVRKVHLHAREIGDDKPSGG
jgi:dTDP-4-amino-4,6-dideoxygalactose transaminase